MSDNEKPGELLMRMIADACVHNTSLVEAIHQRLCPDMMMPDEKAAVDRLARDFLKSYGVIVP